MTARSADQPNSPDKSLDLTAFRQVPENAGLALDQLSAALAGMLDQGEDPYAAPVVETANGATAGHIEVETAAAPDAADDACEITPRTILESMLFVGSPTNEPLTSKQVAGLMRGVRPAEIDALVRELNGEYERRNCPYEIVADGAGYRMRLREKYSKARDRFHGHARAARLSQAAIEVLAAVAYRAPITADEISRLRGTPCGHLLTQLVRRQLLRLERSDTTPRKVHYHTTPRFLQLFGLASLADLPRSGDLEQQ